MCASLIEIPDDDRHTHEQNRPIESIEETVNLLLLAVEHLDLKNSGQIQELKLKVEIILQSSLVNSEQASKLGLVQQYILLPLLDDQHSVDEISRRKDALFTLLNCQKSSFDKRNFELLFEL